MTSKKRRQRGSRTHGGGTHKNRRGAGHRGGRGAAGRSKHEFHNHGPTGKHGFKRPQKTDREVLTIELRDLDEDAALLVADGIAEETANGYRIDARDVVENGYSADSVKVLGGGQVRQSLEVIADAFSGSAESLLSDAGGEAILSERGEAALEAEADDETAEDANEEPIPEGS